MNRHEQRHHFGPYLRYFALFVDKHERSREYAIRLRCGHHIIGIGLRWNELPRQFDKDKPHDTDTVAASGKRECCGDPADCHCHTQHATTESHHQQREGQDEPPSILHRSSGETHG